jgi:hypothetical protein
MYSAGGGFKKRELQKPIARHRVSPASEALTTSYHAYNSRISALTNNIGQRLSDAQKILTQGNAEQARQLVAGIRYSFNDAQQLFVELINRINSCRPEKINEEFLPLLNGMDIVTWKIKHENLLQKLDINIRAFEQKLPASAKRQKVISAAEKADYGKQHVECMQQYNELRVHYNELADRFKKTVADNKKYEEKLSRYEQEFPKSKETIDLCLAKINRLKERLQNLPLGEDIAAKECALYKRALQILFTVDDMVHADELAPEDFLKSFKNLRGALLGLIESDETLKDDIDYFDKWITKITQSIADAADRVEQDIMPAASLKGQQIKEEEKQQVAQEMVKAAPLFTKKQTVQVGPPAQRTKVQKMREKARALREKRLQKQGF